MSVYNLKSIKQRFKKNGIFYTSKELALTLKSYVTINPSTVYDPTCGDGALLEVFDDNIKKYGQEIDSIQLNEASRKLVNFTGRVGDTLKDDKFIDCLFDLIIANPPFSISWTPEVSDDRFNTLPAMPPKSKADYAFIAHILKHLDPKEMAIVLCFPGILYRGNSEGKIRKWLIDNNLISQVISIPPNQFVDTKIATCILVLQKNKTSTEITFESKDLKKIRIVEQQEVVDNDYNLSVSQYIQEEIIEVKYDPLVLENKARSNMIRKLIADLEMSKMICEWENYDFKTYLNEIKEVLKNYE